MKQGLLVLVILVFCSQALAQEHRSFSMGFTSWPYDMTIEAINDVYEKIQDNGDLVEQHLEEGVPWAEALYDKSFSKDFQDSLDFRRSKRVRGQKLLISLSPLSMGRDGLAIYRGDRPNQPLKGEWKKYSLSHPKVKEAYLKYARRLIKFFSPDYCCIGVEVNLLKTNKPELWPAYVQLQKYVYTQLKKEFPELKIFVSMEAMAFLKDDTSHADEIARQSLKDILPYTDILGLSIHPFTSKYLTNPLPIDMFDQLRQLTDKPMAVTESSYPAEKFSMNIHHKKVDFNGSEQKQAEFTRKLLSTAQKDKYLFVSWFTIQDYDKLWDKMGRQELLLVWRDTGFFDENGKPREALSIWREYLEK